MTEQEIHELARALMQDHHQLDTLCADIKINVIMKCVSEPALYEQAAEECIELAHAFLKLARYWRGENPTPVTVEEAENKVTEELSDLKLVLMILGLDGSTEIMKKKLDRWYERIMRQEEDDGTEDA